jgi:protein-disulfide isomerase
MRRSLPFLIIAAVLAVALGAGVLLFRYRMEPLPAPPPPAPTPAPSAAEAMPSPTVTSTVSESPSPTVSVPEIAPPPPTGSATPEPSVAPTATSTPAKPSKPIVFSYGGPGAEPMHVRGDPGAPVVLEEFGDFECMPCSVVWPVLEKLEHEFGQQLVVVFREHPLKKHRFALDAARAAEAAGLQGKFWEMHDTLYRNRATWVPAPYIGPYLNDYAAQLGLDVDRFKADMDGAEITRRLAADWDRGDSLGVDRTPIIYLNGEKVPVTDYNEKGFRARIEKALAARSR